MGYSSDTLAVHAGRADLSSLGVHALPIDLSTTNPLPTVSAGGDSYEAMAGGGHPGEGGAVYARLWNPTVARFETALAALEGTSEAVAFGSGMAALSATILTAQQASGRHHIVAVRPLYGGSDHLLTSGLLGTRVTFCPADAVADSLEADTCLVLLETPSNPTLDLVDVGSVVAQAGDVPVLVDNTFATPILQNPAAHGANVVLHSATKYLGGHGDAMGGVVACDAEWASGLRRVRAITGGLLHPQGAQLLHRGLATLPIRMRAQQASAEKVAAWFSTHPAVSAVHFPGLPGSDPQGLIGRQMRGPGAMIAIRLWGGPAQAARLADRVRLFTHAVSLGSVDSLLQVPAALTHRPVEASAKPAAGLVRLSIGLEDPDDLLADLDHALA